MALVLRSSEFAAGEAIPTLYSRGGRNVSPPLEWSGAPPETRSYVILVEDPDAPRGTFRHWAAYDIPATTRELPADAGAASNPEGLRNAVNDFGNARYDGPQPPAGHGPHHYHFRLAALRTPHLDLPPTAKAIEVWQAAQPHVVAETELVGTFRSVPERQ
jgi:Raf kinase inhibitor-like YbhB/YbcL family protein